jgi:tetratricopeptide (TPR) repeat protein
LPVFRAACSAGREFEWMQYWQNVLSAVKAGATPQVDIASLYLAGFLRLSPGDKSLLGGTLGQFLLDMGYFDAAVQCLEEEDRADSRVEAFAGDSIIRAGILNDKGLIDRDRGRQKEALKQFEDAAAMIEDGEYGEPGYARRERRRLLASILMNIANVTRDSADNASCLSMLQRALPLMMETTGERSPEVATVLQSIGNLAMVQGDFKEALFSHSQARAIRLVKLGPGHRDVGLSLGNIASTLASMQQFYQAMNLWERSLEILKRTVGDEHHYSRGVSQSLERCRQLRDQAMKNESGLGVVLLVFNSLPTAENPPDPTTSVGADMVAMVIRDTLISIWDDTLLHGSSVPVLVVSFPGYEDVVNRACEEPIAKQYIGSLVNSLNIPEVTVGLESPEVASFPPELPPSLAPVFPLLPVIEQFRGWLHSHKVEVLMVKPISCIGAKIDRKLMEFLRLGSQQTSRNSSERQVEHSRDAELNLRPIALEVVPFDQHDGLLVVIYKGDGDPRPCVMPALEWRQRYVPQPGNERATGVFYVNLSRIWQGQSVNPETGLTPLHGWSINTLVDLATQSRDKQLSIFESALSKLSHFAKARAIEYQAERGAIGYPRNSLNQEVEDMLT